MANPLKFAFERVSRGCWPGGTEEGAHRYTAPKSKTSAGSATKSVFFFTILSSEAIGDKSSNLLGKKNHSQDHDEGGPEQ